MTTLHADRLLAGALAAAARDWRVFPLRPGAKEPAVRNWENRATTDPDRIRRAWSTGPYNVGIATGPSGLLVVDLDTPRPGEQPPERWAQDGIGDGLDVLTALAEEHGVVLPLDTHTVATPSGGQHLYFTAPTGSPPLRNTAGTLGWKVDSRAHGGYVVAAGSILGDGRSYRVLEETDPAPLPAWLAGLLHPTEPPPSPPAPVSIGGGRQSRYLAAALADETKRVKNAPCGGRNAALYTAAVALGQLAAGGELTEAHVTETLLHAAAGHIAVGAYSARQARATIESGLRAGAKRPRTLGVGEDAA